jgi:hypothetical protein
MMRPDGYFIRQLDRLGQGLVEPHGLLAAPLLGGWLARKGARAYTTAGSSRHWQRSPGRRSSPSSMRTPPAAQARSEQRSGVRRSALRTSLDCAAGSSSAPQRWPPVAPRSSILPSLLRTS